MNPTQTTLLSIDGMTCGSCVRRVRALLLAWPGVRAADVRLREGEASLAHDGALVLEPLLQALAAEGYGARPAARTLGRAGDLEGEAGAARLG